MTEDKKVEEVQFPLNKKLLEESAKIKEERGVIRERLGKIEASKGQVSAKVYEKVKSDYLAQLNENTDQLLEKKQDIDRELSTLNEARKKVGENVAAHRHSLEEMEFRNSLGEYKKGEYEKLSRDEKEKLAKFEKILAAIESNINQYESLFEGEEEFAEEEVEAAEAIPAPPPPFEKTDETPHIDDEYHVGDEEGYFGPDTEDIPAKIAKKAKGAAPEAVETTQKDLPTAATEGAPRLAIIEGDGKGETFAITKDEITIGRASSNDVVLKEAKVSRQHASIKRQGKEYLISDLHSSNGVFVNDEKIKEYALSDGDVIKIGDFALKFTY